MEQHSSQDPWGWLSIFSYASRAFHASREEPECMQRGPNKKLTKRQGKAKKSGEAGRQHNKTITCPNSSGLLSMFISSPWVFLLTDSELQRRLASGKLNPGAAVEGNLAASHQDDSALDWEGFTDMLWYYKDFFFFFFVICCLELTVFSLKLRWKLALGEWSVRRQLREGMYSEGGNYVDTNREVYLGQ